MKIKMPRRVVRIKNKPDCLQARWISGLSILMKNKMPERRTNARIENFVARYGCLYRNNQADGFVVVMNRSAATA
jgi:hypothetical protein